MALARQRALLEWYREHKRKLPWRRDRDPYRVWVSEVMLQQTRVETVIPYFDRWMDWFPDPVALAAAAEDRVLKAWEGLGYYARARNLHQAAREVVTQYGGTVPDDPDAFARLPGVGPYISGAVQSIAYDRVAPAVDGNVLRVLSRWFNLDDDVGQPATRRKVAGMVQELIPGDAAGDFNQALMELGALICIPGQPRCEQCPVTQWCAARRAGRERGLPVKAGRAAPRPVAMVAAVLAEGDRVLLCRRPGRGLLAGMWEFPSAELAADAKASAAAVRLLLERCGVAAAAERMLHPVEHVFTHRHWRLQPVLCRLTPASPRPRDRAELRWLSPGEFAEVALPAVFRKVAVQVASR